MAIAFKLIDKTTQEAVSLALVDNEICENVLNIIPDDKIWGGTHPTLSFDWYNTIGFQIANGLELGSQELRDHYLKSTMWADEAPIISKIIDYLEMRFVSTSFYVK